MKNKQLKAALVSELLEMQSRLNDGINVTDDIVDEMGDYFDDVQECGDAVIVEAYEAVRECIDEECDVQAKAVEFALNKLCKICVK